MFLQLISSCRTRRQKILRIYHNLLFLDSFPSLSFCYALVIHPTVKDLCCCLSSIFYPCPTHRPKRRSLIYINIRISNALSFSPATQTLVFWECLVVKIAIESTLFCSQFLDCYADTGCQRSTCRVSGTKIIAAVE